MVLPDSDGNSFPSHEPCEQVCNVSKYSLPKIQTDIWNLPSIFGPWISNRFPYISIIFHIFPYISIYFQIFPYISIYFHICPLPPAPVFHGFSCFTMGIPTAAWCCCSSHSSWHGWAHRGRATQGALLVELTQRERYREV